jgi:hypothetical protein
VKRKDSSVDFVLHACLQHNHDETTSDTNLASLQRDANVETTSFASLDEAVKWLYDHELDAIFRLERDSSRKNRSIYRKYVCRRAGRYEPKKNTTKKNTSCGANIVLRTSDDGVKMQSQLSHTHAELEFWVMSDKQKFEIITPLQAGVSRARIMQKIIGKSSDHDVGRSVTTIWHLDKKHVKQDIDTKVADSVNVYKLLIEKEDWRAFNLRLHYGQPPAYLSHKEVETGPNSVFMFSMSDNQQEVFCQNPRVLMMDSTHGTNRHGLLLLTGSVLDERGTNVDVFQAMISTENEDQVTSALKIMKSMEPEACSNVDTLTSDLNRATVNSFKDVINPNVNFVTCGWHVKATIEIPESLTQELGPGQVEPLEDVGKGGDLWHGCAGAVDNLQLS